MLSYERWVKKNLSKRSESEQAEILQRVKALNDEAKSTPKTDKRHQEIVDEVVSILDEIGDEIDLFEKISNIINEVDKI